MTTIPTEIIFDTEFTQPVLYLNAQILTVFQETLLALRQRIDLMGIEEAQEKLAQYPHLAKIPRQIQQAVGLTIPSKSEGSKKIIHTLTSLNDIIRVCSLLDP